MLSTPKNVFSTILMVFVISVVAWNTVLIHSREMVAQHNSVTLQIILKTLDRNFEANQLVAKRACTPQ